MIIRTLLNRTQERIRNATARSTLNGLVTPFLPAALPLLSQAESLLRALEISGTEYLPSLATREQSLALREELAKRPCFDPWNPESGEFAFENTPPTANNARIRDVAAIPFARELANHPLVLSVASNYLGCAPTIDDIVAWWSLPGRPAPKEEQFFHRDNDAIRFLKLFVYLSDVEELDGAHNFVSGSHRDNRLNARGRRYLDSEVLQAFGSEAVLRMTGSMGSAFIEDTFGLHKGDVPQRRPRLVFQVRYTSYPSIFAQARSRPAGDSGYDPYTNRFL